MIEQINRGFNFIYTPTPVPGWVERVDTQKVSNKVYFEESRKFRSSIITCRREKQPQPNPFSTFIENCYHPSLASIHCPGVVKRTNEVSFIRKLSFQLLPPFGESGRRAKQLIFGRNFFLLILDRERDLCKSYTHPEIQLSSFARCF